METRPTPDFREISAPVLGGMVGLFIAMPLAPGYSPAPALALLALFTTIGVAIGFRRRKSVIFFYFCLISAVLLAWILVFRMTSIG